jgi:hypothetical protein
MVKPNREGLMSSHYVVVVAWCRYRQFIVCRIVPTYIMMSYTGVTRSVYRYDVLHHDTQNDSDL